jgi:hypothetical protein
MKNDECVQGHGDGWCCSVDGRPSGIYTLISLKMGQQKVTPNASGLQVVRSMAMMEQICAPMCIGRLCDTTASS